MKKHQFFQNRECEYFPCHDMNEDVLNCLFCYCPLYMLGDKCGGNFSYTEKGIKNCKACTRPHDVGGYEYIRSRFSDVSRLASKKDGDAE